MTVEPASLRRPSPSPVERLRRLVGEHLDVRAPRDLDASGTGKPISVVDLSWDADLSELAPTDDPVIPVYGLRGRVVIGPLRRPGHAGCPHCLALRVRSSDGPRGVPVGPESSPRRLSARADWWTRPGVEELVAAVLRDEADRLLTGEPSRCVDSVFAIGPARANGGWHPALPHALCGSPHCERLRQDIPPPIPDLSRPLPTTAPGSARHFPVTRYRNRLEEEYLDTWSGVTGEPSVGDVVALPSAQVRVPTVWGFKEVAIGRADDYSAARPAAILEGLERYAGWHCGGRDPVRFAAYSELDDAVDPRSLILHPEESYQTPGFEYSPFTPDTPTGWAEAHSAHDGRRVLVPFHVAYYGSTRRPDTGPRFVYENSNGCALGSGTEEALLAALLEVAERDAFLCAWYSRTPLPEVDLTSLPTKVGRGVNAVRQRTGRELRAFRAVGLLGIPVVVLVSTSSKPDLPMTLVTAGSGMTTERALLGALHEMAAVAPAVSVSYKERRAELEPALEDPNMVRTMEDHALVGALPGARARFSFLLDETAPATAQPRTPADDIAADLAALLTIAEGEGREVLVVDHTTPELTRLDMRCVKAIVPGAVPMTFGHRHRRLPPPHALTAFRARNGGSRTHPSEEASHEPHPFP